MQKTLAHPVKFTVITLAAALVCTLLRSLALCLAFEGNYFTGAPLATVQAVMTALALAALIILPLVASWRAPITAKEPKGHALFTKLTAALAALALFLCFISACIAGGTLGLPAIILVVTFPSLLAGIVYFILHLFGKSASDTVRIAFGSILLIAFAALICLTYFDIGTQMNAPHKISQHVALLAVMLWLLYDMRAAAGAPRPRMQTAVTPAALFLCLTNGVSNTIGYIAGKYTSSLFFATDLLLLVLALYIVARTKELYH